MMIGRFVSTTALALVAIASGSASIARAADQRAFELRTYTAAEGKLDALHARFREHTIGLFEKHGMEVIGFWTPVGDKAAPNTLVYLLAYPSVEARAASWKGFVDDPEWKKVYAESQKDGSLTTKVESVMLAPTDYSAMK
jgi:hypothetical protein